MKNKHNFDNLSVGFFFHSEENYDIDGMTERT